MTEINILEAAHTLKVTLLDDKEYTIPPMSLNNLARVERIMGVKMAQMAEKLKTDGMEASIMVAHALLSLNYPELSLSQVGDLVGTKELTKMVGHITQ